MFTSIKINSIPRRLGFFFCIRNSLRGKINGLSWYETDRIWNYCRGKDHPHSECDKYWSQFRLTLRVGCTDYSKMDRRRIDLALDAALFSPSPWRAAPCQLVNGINRESREHCIIYVYRYTYHTKRRVFEIEFSEQVFHYYSHCDVRQNIPLICANNIIVSIYLTLPLAVWCLRLSIIIQFAIGPFTFKLSKGPSAVLHSSPLPA